MLCSCRQSEEAQLKNCSFSAQYISALRIPVFKAHLVHKHEPNVINMSHSNGIVPEVYFGDTLGWQYYLNGKKHGPYFSMFNPNFDTHDISEVGDGTYKNGLKHGYFIRYHAYHDIQYVAYYEEDEMLWIGYLEPIELYPTMPYFLKRKNLSVHVKHTNGKTWFMGEYRNGMPYGKHKYYYSSGQKKGEIDYNKLTITQFWDGNRNADTWSFADDKHWQDQSR